LIELARQRSELAQRWTTKQRFLQDGDCARTYGLFGNGMIGCARQQDRCKMRAEIPGKSDEGDAADSRQGRVARASCTDSSGSMTKTVSDSVVPACWTIALFMAISMCWPVGSNYPELR
jgi:hypothetical protein